MPIARPDPAVPNLNTTSPRRLSSWWRCISVLTMAPGFALLVLLTFRVYHERAYRGSANYSRWIRVRSNRENDCHRRT